eukprot:scaffold21470_cov90-Isochrysis_galbana.AAC.3
MGASAAAAGSSEFGPARTLSRPSSHARCAQRACPKRGAAASISSRLACCSRDLRLCADCIASASATMSTSPTALVPPAAVSSADAAAAAAGASPSSTSGTRPKRRMSSEEA